MPMDLDRRAVLLAGAAFAARSAPLQSQPRQALRPEDFGARGDGQTNDTAAFAALTAEMQRRQGGMIWLAPSRTYVLGRQDRGGPMGWTPVPLLELSGLTSSLRIVGNGARLICQAGLRYGTFDPASGRPVERPMPNFKTSDLASPYNALIRIKDCSAPITITDLELDGNLEQLRIGGKFGDTGWQIPGTGLLLEGNLASETILNVFSHHHGQDGLIIVGNDKRASRSRFSKVIARFNGRQGLSLTGGRGYDFEDCEFSKTGRSAIASSPGAGVDIEAEVGTIRDITFSRCEFSDNFGVGMVADTGNSAHVRFTDCTFVGTTGWSAWPYKPGFVFERCKFAGSVVRAYASDEPALGTKFLHCQFSDDPRKSPTGRLFVGGGPILNLAESQNVVFADCDFTLVNDGVLPWSWRATYRDCAMKQASPVTAMTKGKYLGRTVIDGPVDFYGSMIAGTVVANGKILPLGPVGDISPW